MERRGEKCLVAGLVLFGALCLPACASTRPPLDLPPSPPSEPTVATVDASGSDATPLPVSSSPEGREGETKSWWHDAMAVAPERMAMDCDLMRADYSHYYTMGNIAMLGLGIGVAAPIANSSADESVAHWYQHHARGETSDEFAQVANYAGEFWLVLPLAVEGAGLMGQMDEGYWHDGGLGEWSNRSLRAVAVGVPPMLAMYVVLGSGRPDRHDSHWHPFNDVHGVSGHTFMGAVPFLTAAAMTDDWMWQVPLVAGSMATGWSRINDNRHYLSQAILGWWMAYLAVRSVSEGQRDMKSVTLAPAIFDDGAGVAIQIRY